MTLAASCRHPAHLAEPAPVTPDWRDETAYSCLLQAGPAGIAWEWLRRKREYRLAFDAARDWRPKVFNQPCFWGLCAFSDPALDYASARPLWHQYLYPMVLPVEVVRRGHAPTIDLGHLAGGPLTAADGANGIQHCLYMDAGTYLRFDLAGGTITGGPFVPRFPLLGTRSVVLLLPLVRQFLDMALTGKTRSWESPPNWSCRRLLELRTSDALAAGASQREIAASLLDGDAFGPGWRDGLSSVRSRAQRLVRSARRMEEGGWRALLAGREREEPVLSIGRDR